ncbi:MAG TPA: glycosyltransferase family 39 protein [Acidimicrobiales bacterium]|nr:glycosyltransferase family 39 protein [Acidimicrobiales bacterium]
MQLEEPLAAHDDEHHRHRDPGFGPNVDVPGSSPGWSRIDGAALAGLVAVLAGLWGRARGTWYWTDEALSLGISSHPLAAMPDLLAQDTSPPLYHVLLRGWLLIFGSSEASTHTLSLLFALAVVPAALWAGWSLFDRRTGWMCALLAAVSPFLAVYANETRMYSLVALLSVLVTATFLHAFVLRRRRYLPAFSIALTLALYTHYWALFLAVGAGVGVLVCLAFDADRRRLLIDAGLAFGAVVALFAPWVPTLVYQQAHSAVGWALPPSVHQVRDDLVWLIGGPFAAVALALAAGTALVAVVRRPWDRTAILVGVTAVISAVAVATGLVSSRSSSQWHGRYLGVVLAPVLLLFGTGLARAGQAAVAALAVVAVLAGPINVVRPEDKSDTKAIVEQATPLLEPGDLVFAPIGAVPLLAHYLPPGLRYATTTGPVVDPLAADWRDAIERLSSSDARRTLEPMLDRLATGGHVLVTCPLADESSLGGLPEYIQLEITRCLQGQRLLLEHPELEIVQPLRFPPDGGPPEAHVLGKVATTE